MAIMGRDGKFLLEMEGKPGMGADGKFLKSLYIVGRGVLTPLYIAYPPFFNCCPPPPPPPPRKQTPTSTVLSVVMFL